MAHLHLALRSALVVTRPAAFDSVPPRRVPPAALSTPPPPKRGSWGCTRPAETSQREFSDLQRDLVPTKAVSQEEAAGGEHDGLQLSAAGGVRRVRCTI